VGLIYLIYKARYSRNFRGVMEWTGSKQESCAIAGKFQTCWSLQ